MNVMRWTYRELWNVQSLADYSPWGCKRVGHNFLVVARRWNWKLVQAWSGLLRWHSGKETCCQCRRCKRCQFDPELGRSPGEGNGNPLQYSCLGNSMAGGAWRATVHGTAKSQTWLSTCAHRPDITVKVRPEPCSPASVREMLIICQPVGASHVK